MTEHPVWQRTVPDAPGFFWYRAHNLADLEIIHCYEAGKATIQPSWPLYGWPPESLLAKRIHEPEAEKAEAMQGLYLVGPGSLSPVSLVTPSLPSGAPENLEYSPPAEE